MDTDAQLRTSGLLSDLYSLFLSLSHIKQTHQFPTHPPNSKAKSIHARSRALSVSMFSVVLIESFYPPSFFFFFVNNVFVRLSLANVCIFRSRVLLVNQNALDRIYTTRPSRFTSIQIL